MNKIKMIAQPVLLFVLIAIFASACGTQSNSSNSSAPSGKAVDSASAPITDAKKVIRIGTTAGSPPFAFLNDEQKYDGYDIEIVQTVAQKAGYEIEWTKAAFTGLVGMLDTGKIDTIANKVAINEERKQKYLFTIPYVYSGAQLVVKKDNDTIKTFNDLKGKKVAVVSGNNYEKMLKEFDTNNEIKIVGYDDNGPILNELALGRVDAFLGDQIVALIEIEKSKLPLKIATDQPIKPVQNAFPFLPSNKEMYDSFNKALEELEKDGTLSKLSQKWLNTDATKH